MKIHVVDQIMGQGKTSAAINYINALPEDEKVMFVTPYNNKEKDRAGNYKNANEVQRIIDACPDKKFAEPSEKPNKIAGIKQLLREGRNIATTHALFSLFDDEIVELCYAQGYTLFMDEVTDVVEPYTKLSKDDLNLLINEGYISIDKESKLLIWNDDKPYRGKFSDVRIMCMNECLAIYGDNISLWLFPVKIFKAFQESYILTYLFESQMQKYYYDYNHLEYDYMYVTGDSVENYSFTTKPQENHIKYDYKKLIHIVSNVKMNIIGDIDHSLSKGWYKYHGSNKDTHKKCDALMEKLQKSTYNFFYNVTKDGKSANNLWTCFKDYQKDLKGKGYAKSFLSHNVRATNKFADCHNVAYLINKYINPMIKNFFLANGIGVDEDGYALSEMLQFIWRSAIRNGEDIYIYIPSKRMRNLLIKWIDENRMI